jgi:hypothetical protein
VPYVVASHTPLETGLPKRPRTWASTSASGTQGKRDKGKRDRFASGSLSRRRTCLTSQYRTRPAFPRR